MPALSASRTTAPRSTAPQRRAPAPGQPLSDADLMRGVAARDHICFEKLYSRFSGRLLAMLRNQCHEPQVAEDLLQEVFVLVWRKAGTYRESRGPVAGWIYAVARNRVIDHQRRQKPTRELPEIEPGEEEAGRPSSEPSDLRITLEQAMGILGAKERDCLRLAYFGGLTYREAAERLGIPLGTLLERWSIRSVLSEA